MHFHLVETAVDPSANDGTFDLGERFLTKIKSSPFEREAIHLVISRMLYHLRYESPAGNVGIFI